MLFKPSQGRGIKPGVPAKKPKAHVNAAVCAEGSRACPLCRKLMRPQMREGVKLDVCADHGVWFDRGEFAAVIRYARKNVTRHALRMAGLTVGGDAYQRGFAEGTSPVLKVVSWVDVIVSPLALLTVLCSYAAEAVGAGLNALDRASTRKKKRDLPLPPTKVPPASRRRADDLRDCPICKQLMPRGKKSGFAFDYCPDHGAWFGRREFEALLARVKTSVLRHATQAGERTVAEQAYARGLKDGARYDLWGS